MMKKDRSGVYGVVAFVSLLLAMVTSYFWGVADPAVSTACAVSSLIFGVVCTVSIVRYMTIIAHRANGMTKKGA